MSKPLEIGRRRLEKFKKPKYDPYDIKALMHPVDFIVFNGLNDGTEVKDFTFLTRKPTNRELNQILASIKNCGKKGL